MLVAVKLIGASPWNVANRLIWAWTRSPVVHCELVLENQPLPLSISAQPARGVVIHPLADVLTDLAQWQAWRIPGPVDETAVLEMGLAWAGTPYNMSGLFWSQVMGRSAEVAGHWFCSEFCFAALQQFAPGLELPNTDPDTVSPARLATWLATRCEPVSLTDFDL